MARDQFPQLFLRDGELFLGKRRLDLFTRKARDLVARRADSGADRSGHDRSRAVLELGQHREVAFVGDILGRKGTGFERVRLFQFQPLGFGQARDAILQALGKTVLEEVSYARRGQAFDLDRESSSVPFI